VETKVTGLGNTIVIRLVGGVGGIIVIGPINMSIPTGKKPTTQEK